MISLSYRREDSVAIAGRLYDRLQSSFGKKNVFMDFDSIPGGADFREHISRTIEESDVVIALIGPNWLGQGDGARRIDDPADFVRLEVGLALERGIPVIPVLINQTEMPKPDLLPENLQALPYRNALPLDSGRDFHSHAERLVGAVRAIAPRRGRQKRVWQRGPVRWAIVLLGIIALALIGGIVLFVLIIAPPARRTANPAPDTAAVSPAAAPTASPKAGIPGTVSHTSPATPAPSAPKLVPRPSPPAGPKGTKWSLGDFAGRWSNEKSNPIPGGEGSVLASHDHLTVNGNAIIETVTTEWTTKNKVFFRMTLTVKFGELQLYGNQLNAHCLSAEITDLYDPNDFGKMANIAGQTKEAAKKGVGLTFAWTLTETELRRGETAWTKDK